MGALEKILHLGSRKNVGQQMLWQGDMVSEFEPLISRIEQDAPYKLSIFPDIMELKNKAEKVFGSVAVCSEDSLHSNMIDLPVTCAEAIVQLGLRRAVNTRLMSGWYQDKLFFLINSEKSSSTLHEIVIRIMLKDTLGLTENFGIQRGLTYGPTEIGTEASIHGLIHMYAPDGGVLRSPFLPYHGNYRRIKILKNKVILLTRHPADRMVARVCMNNDSTGVKLFNEKLAAGTAFNEMFELNINSSLRYDLEWMSGWLFTLKHTGLLYQVRYEDMLKDPHKHFNGIHKFLTGQEITQSISDQISDKMSRTKSGGDLQPGATKARSYPKGYSGKVGVWRDYFNEKDIETYNKIVKSFLEYDPKAEGLLDIYPDLKLDE
ncbi:MAG: sulfotransferase domain-containing protein [Pseudomonadota bacterium]